MLQLGKQLSPEQRLQKCTVDILSHPRYIPLGGVLMIGEKAINDQKARGTACTNGRDEWYSSVMIDALRDSDVRFVLIHESKHKMYRHLITWRNLFDIDPYLANLACDHVINLEILAENPDGFATMPEGEYKGHADPRFKGMGAAQVFNILRQEQPEPPQGGGDGNDEPDDGQGQGSGKGQGGTDKDGNKPGEGFDNHDWTDAQDMSAEDKAELERDIDQAIRQGALAAGKMGDASTIDVKELLKPQVDWRKVLNEFVKNTCTGNDYSTYNRPNRRYMSQGLIMPTGIKDQVGELLFGIDMSGSTGVGKMRPTFLSECQATCDTVSPELIRVIYWDNEVRRAETYTPEEQKDFLKNTVPTGGGGTTVECLDQYVKDNNIKPQAIVILTDGDLYGGWGSFQCPVLWLIVDNPRVRAPYGKTINIDSATA